MAIVVHVRASVTAKLPWGREQALIFLNELLPAAPDVVVQVAHLASAGSPEDAGAQQALDVFVDAVARNDPRTRNLYFDATTLGEPPTPANAQRWATAISTGADPNSVRLRCDDGCCDAGRRVDGDAQAVAADRRRVRAHCQQHDAVYAVKRGVKTSEVTSYRQKLKWSTRAKEGKMSRRGIEPTARPMRSPSSDYSRVVAKWRGIARPRIDRHHDVIQE